MGSGSVTDNQGAQQMVDCGLIEVPAYTATAAKGSVGQPRAAHSQPVELLSTPARRKFIAKQHPDAVKKAALLYGDIATAADPGQAHPEGVRDEAGFKFTYVKKTPVISESYTSEVQDMKSKGIQYVTMVSALQEVQKLLRDMDTQDFKPEVVDLGQQYYDPELPPSARCGRRARAGQHGPVRGGRPEPGAAGLRGGVQEGEARTSSPRHSGCRHSRQVCCSPPRSRPRATT